MYYKHVVSLNDNDSFKNFFVYFTCTVSCAYNITNN